MVAPGMAYATGYETRDYPNGLVAGGQEQGGGALCGEGGGAQTRLKVRRGGRKQPPSAAQRALRLTAFSGFFEAAKTMPALVKIRAQTWKPTLPRLLAGRRLDRGRRPVVVTTSSRGYAVAVRLRFATGQRRLRYPEG